MFRPTAELDAFRLPARGEGAPIESKPVADKKLFALAAESLAAGTVVRPSVAAWIERGGGESSFDDEADLLIIVGNMKAGAKLTSNLIDRWFERYGARGAAEIVTRVGSWVPYPQFPTSMLLNPLLERVRRHFAHAADYDAARAFLAGHPDRASLPAWPSSGYNPSREMLSYLLPRTSAVRRGRRARDRNQVSDHVPPRVGSQRCRPRVDRRRHRIH